VEFYRIAKKHFATSSHQHQKSLHMFLKQSIQNRNRTKTTLSFKHIMVNKATLREKISKRKRSNNTLVKFFIFVSCHEDFTT